VIETDATLSATAGAPRADGGNGHGP
jgi:hypothetical protein